MYISTVPKNDMFNGFVVSKPEHITKSAEWAVALFTNRDKLNQYRN